MIRPRAGVYGRPRTQETTRRRRRTSRICANLGHGGARDSGATRWRFDIALSPTSVDLASFTVVPVSPGDPSWDRMISVMTSSGVGHPGHQPA